MKKFILWRKSIYFKAFSIFTMNLCLRIYLNWPLNQTISTPDSISYRPSIPGPQTFPYEGNVTLSKLSEISFIGSSLRPWTINLIFQLFSSDTQILLFHVLFASFVWSFLIFILLKSQFPIINKLLSVIVVFLFSLTPFVYSWEKFILSESIVNSTFILFTGLLINKLNNKSVNDLFLFSSWLFLLISRPIFGIFLIPLLFLNLKIKKIQIYFQRVIPCLISLIYVFVLNQNSSQKWLEYMGTPREGLTVSHFVSTNFKKNTDFKLFLKSTSAPECLYADKFQKDNPWFTARSYDTVCDNGVIWVQDQFLPNYILFLTSPNNLYNFVLINSFESLKGVDFRNYYPFFAQTTPFIFSFLNSLFWIQNIFQLYIYLLIPAFLFIFIYMRKRQYSLLIWIYFFSIVGSLAQIAFMATDYGRLGLPGSIIFNLFSFLFLANLIIYFFKESKSLVKII